MKRFLKWVQAFYGRWNRKVSIISQTSHLVSCHIYSMLRRLHWIISRLEEARLSHIKIYLLTWSRLKCNTVLRNLLFDYLNTFLVSLLLEKINIGNVEYVSGSLLSLFNRTALFQKLFESLFIRDCINSLRLIAFYSRAFLKWSLSLIFSCIKCVVYFRS